MRRLSVSARCCGFVLLVSAICFLGGCAAEAPPRPPRIEAPEPVTDLSVAQVGHSLILRFQAPQFAADGRRLTKPIEVEIFREISPQGHVSQASFEARKPWVILRPAALVRLTRNGEIRYRYRLSPADFSRLGRSTFAFRVVALTRGFRGHPRLSDPSNIAETRLLPVPAAVTGLALRQERGAIDLSWQASSLAVNAPAPKLTGYTVLRAVGAGSTVFASVAQVGLPTYQDKQFRFGITYSYRVRAAFAENGYTAQTEDSNSVAITPRPIFPPPPPTALAAVFTGTAVQLIWKPDSAADIAGYNVYREIRGAPPKRLNQKLIGTTVYADHSARPGSQYVYWVTAVDSHHNESQPSNQASVTTH